MSARRLRALVVIAIAALSTLALALAAGASSSAVAAGSGSADHALLITCEKAILLGPGSHSPAAPGSGTAIAAHFAVFRRPRSASDALPAGLRIGPALGFAHVSSYDPTRLVRLRRQGSGALYAFPATIAPVTLPAGCGDLPQLNGINAYLAAQQDERGTGLGACLIAVAREPAGLPGPYLPGARKPTVTTRPRVTLATCESDAILTGYTGALGNAFGNRLALVPDGVDAITYTLASGRRLTASVTGNLVKSPAALVIAPSPHRMTAGGARRRARRPSADDDFRDRPVGAAGCDTEPSGHPDPGPGGRGDVPGPSRCVVIALGGYIRGRRKLVEQFGRRRGLVSEKHASLRCRAGQQLLRPPSAVPDHPADLPLPLRR